MSYYFHPAAEAEYLETIAFYEERRAGLGASFVSFFKDTMDGIIEAPHRYRVERQLGIRRKGLRSFPYHVVYRNKAGAIQILTV